MKVQFPLLTLLIASCASTYYELKGHQEWADARKGAPPNIELQVGARRIALVRGTTWGSGGYKVGLASKDPSVVRVLCEDSSLRGDVYLLGVSEGETRVYYGNAWILPYADGGQSLDHESIQALGAEHDAFVQHNSIGAQYFTVWVRTKGSAE